MNCSPRMRFAYAALILTALIAVPAEADTATDRPAVPVFRPLRTDVPPVLDGRLDDPVWSEAPSVAGFKTFIPDFDREPAQPTTAYMAYDAENLYFAFKCFDTEPEKIKAAVAGRDTIRPDDFVCINLDTFNDQQSLYAFYVNPLGIQTDSRFASGQEDFSVDVVWYSAGRIDPDGYSVELRIPFKSIRYAGRERVEMSIFFERRISRNSEHSCYPALDPARGYAFLTQMMSFELLEIERYALVEAIPAVTYNQTYDRPAGRLRREDPLRDFGLTGKYGVTSQLILDAAWNPDFSQVEADAGQVDANLRYDLFYPEKRPFFLEGSEMFLLGGASGDSPLQSVVHTRTIIDPRAGFKLSGKVGKRDTVAGIFALDEAPSLDSNAAAGDRYAEVAVLRYKRALSQDGYVGGFYTGRDYAGDFNRVAGVDGQIRLSRSKILGFHGFGSRTRVGGAPAAAGHAFGLDVSHDSRDLGINLALIRVSPEFVTETGYLTRTGLTAAAASIGPKLYPHSRIIRRVQPRLFGSILRDQPSGLSEVDAGAMAVVLLPGNTQFILSGEYATEVFLGRRFETSGWNATATSQVTKQFYVRAQMRRGLSIRYAADPYQGRGSRATLSLIYQPSDQLNWTGSLSYADFVRSSDGGGDFDYAILRNRFTYQLNKYLFLRAVVEYNDFRRNLLTDFLASFTYIPGTVLQLGYGSIYDRVRWAEEDGFYRPSDRFLEMRRGLFFKASYLWRL